jgi:hypothetical protein
MSYIPLKAPVQYPSLGTAPRRSFDGWVLSWNEARYSKERIGLLHEIYETDASSETAFRYLLEIANEFHGLISDKPGLGVEKLYDIAETAAEVAAKRQLKPGEPQRVFFNNPQMVGCFLWFMRVENYEIANHRILMRRERTWEFMEDILEQLCARAFTSDWYDFHKYRGEALQTLYALGKLTQVIPRNIQPSVLFHPWNMFDERAMSTLKALAIYDASKTGGNSVEMALVHGSEAAAVYVAAQQAHASLARFRVK